MSALTDRKGRWLQRAGGKVFCFLCVSRRRAATAITRRTCTTRQESWNRRSPSRRKRVKTSGRYEYRERIGKRAVILWRYTALLLRVKVRKSARHHLNCKFKSKLKQEDQPSVRKSETACGV